MRRLIALLVGTTLFSAASPRKELMDLTPGENIEAPIPGLSSEVEVPDDLVVARKRFGHQAQLAELRRTRPEPSGSFSFGVIGDAEPGRFFFQKWWNPGKDAFEKQLAEITDRGPDLVMQLGDFVSKGTLKNYREHVAFLEANLHLPMIHVIGNHDRSKPNGKADKIMYSAVFGETDLFFDHNGVRFIAFDTSDYGATDAQLDWLDQALDTRNRKLIFTHIVPAYLKGNITSEKPANGKSLSEKLMPKGFFHTGSDRFGEIVARRGVARVYMGHIHAYGTADYGGVKYVLSGGGGSPLYPLPPGYPKYKPAHYLWVDVTPSGLEETVHTMQGEAFPVVFKHLAADRTSATGK